MTCVSSDVILILSQNAYRAPAIKPVFFCLFNEVNDVIRMILVAAMAIMLTGCGSIISRTIPGQGHGNQYYPGVKWDLRDSAWRYVTILDLPFSLVFDTLLLPIDANHGPYE